MTQPIPEVYTDEHGQYCLIPLTRGQFAMIDIGDYEWLSQWKWHARFRSDKKSYYVSRQSQRDGSGKQHTIRMHRQIMSTPIAWHTDHEDGNGLNNRRYNLRKCTSSQNSCNRKMSITNTTGRKGVFWRPKMGKWVAMIGIRRKRIYLGIFSSIEAASAAYRTAAGKYHGAFNSKDDPKP